MEVKTFNFQLGKVVVTVIHDDVKVLSIKVTDNLQENLNYESEYYYKSIVKQLLDEDTNLNTEGT